MQVPATNLSQTVPSASRSFLRTNRVALHSPEDRTVYRTDEAARLIETECKGN